MRFQAGADECAVDGLRKQPFERLRPERSLDGAARMCRGEWGCARYGQLLHVDDGAAGAAPLAEQASNIVFGLRANALDPHGLVEAFLDVDDQEHSVVWQCLHIKYEGKPHSLVKGHF